ncbi:MAG: hypothetical protein LW714_10305 [Oxalobacteraceae bacterium]|nr:hypothetical protein [Oxalobacteraceae bacterium]
MSSLKEKLYDHLRDDVYCKLGVSTIHGIGVFALRDIPKGTAPLRSMVSNKEIKFSRIELKKVPSSVRKHLATFCLVEKGRVFAPEIGMNAVNISIYLNHSKTPNLRFDDKRFVYMGHSLSSYILELNWHRTISVNLIELFWFEIDL